MGANPFKCKSSQQMLLADHRAKTALVMKAEGYTVAEIAEELKMSIRGAYDALARGYKQAKDEASEEIKASVMAAMRKKLTQCAEILKNSQSEKIKLQAMTTYLKFQDSMNKLTGINAPERTDINLNAETILRLHGKEWESL